MKLRSDLLAAASSVSIEVITTIFTLPDLTDMSIHIYLDS